MTSSQISHLIPPSSPLKSSPARHLRTVLATATAAFAFAISPAQAQEAGESSILNGATELASIEPAAPLQPGVIRLKLHNVEDLRAPRDSKPIPDALPTVPDGLPLSDADELKKQAQTEYLAVKLKKQVEVVRKYVDLAWAEASKRENLDPELIIAIIKRESAFRPQVQSSYGAQGLTQVVRRWHHDKLRPSESLFDPEVNIRVGADVLEEYLELAKGDLNTALRKYSGNARGYVNSILNDSRALARIGERAATQGKLASRDVVAQG